MMQSNILFPRFKTGSGKRTRQNVEICKYALSNQLAEVSFFQDNLTSATGCVAGKDKPWIEQYLNGSANEIRVKTETLDSILRKDRTPSLIKIDVEGHEVEVLQGARNTIREAKPMMIIESFPPKQSTVLSLLHELGYRSIYYTPICGMEYMHCALLNYQAVECVYHLYQ